MSSANTTAQSRERHLQIQLFESINDKLDKVDVRFDKVEDRFDKLSDSITDVSTRLTRIEASDVASRVQKLEDTIHQTDTRITKLETILLPVTGLGSALAGALVTWAFNLLPHT
ncbi:hypothetical protein HOU02_gp545 [Caulobacter phage CcrBL9]|uniref:Uncharacterized protein n=1 Tax=Caulobacter phage CcrBL9 TaxID=2283270 RepID=A0A385EBZ6_9CAUD|nr:hypothetical protein HOU02_gp545 [Caulobacter phage CcrBL9]AXQ69180.1 hypothetical protein CcrBL9_gp156 [Caulobacter phage CcrBL9]